MPPLRPKDRFARTRLYLPYFSNRSPPRDYISSCGIPAQFVSTYHSVRLQNSFAFMRKRTDYFFSGRSSNGTASRGTNFLFSFFYLPSSIGLLMLNFRNTTTLGLHERACWPDLPGLRMSSFRALALVKRVFLCVFLFLLSCCLFVVSPYENITHHMTKLYTPVKTPSYNISTAPHLHDYCKTPSRTNHYTI